MTLTEKIEVEDKVLASGEFADLRCGRYMGHLVAVKTLRVAEQDVEQDGFMKIRKVSIVAIFSPLGTRSSPSFSSDSARRLSSGGWYPIHTP